LEIGGKTLLDGANLAITRGQKVALIGENGTGKSTLLKHIVANKDHAVEVGRYVKMAYYDQENVNLNTENTVLAEMWERHVAARQTDVRAELARCGLGQEDMEKKVGSLSGGERAKLALCVFESEHGNFLLLDEPTNHLDLVARESLEEALKTFDGTLLFVSHDRYFLSALADTIAEIKDGKLTVFDGGYEAFNAQKRALAAKAEQAEKEQEQKVFEENKKAAYRTKQERAQEEKRKQQAKTLEKQITALESEEAEIGESLADPVVACDYEKVGKLCKRLEELKEQLEALYAEYEKFI
jgi:ATP-binding cassette subfamily F protein 3